MFIPISLINPRVGAAISSTKMVMAIEKTASVNAKTRSLG